VPKKKSTTSPPKETLAAYQDPQRRTCLMVRRAMGQVAYIPLITGKSVRMLQIKEASFDAIWKPVPDYPAVKAAQLFLRYTQDLGAEKDVLEALAAVIKVTPTQRERAAEILNKNNQPAPTATRPKGAF
jgi:hypothetical protein